MALCYDAALRLVFWFAAPVIVAGWLDIAAGVGWRQYFPLVTVAMILLLVPFSKPDIRLMYQALMITLGMILCNLDTQGLLRG